MSSSSKSNAPSKAGSAPNISPEVAAEIAYLMRTPGAMSEGLQRPGGRGHYDPNQPRVPAGDPKGGRWMDTGDGDQPLVQQARGPFPRPIQKGIEAALAVFAALSARNTPDRRAIIEFNARGYRTDESGELNRANVEVLNRNQVRESCPRLEEVQSRTDGAAETVRRGGGIMSPQQFGTAVHTNLKRQIDSLNDPNLRAEVSRLKSEFEEVRHGRRGSIRVDVLENAGGGTVCVYDIKTGASGLSPAEWPR